MVIPPVFLESYWKYACTYLLVWSPIILMEFLFAPTVPSPPRPQNLHSMVPSAAVFGRFLLLQRQVGNVVVDADGEAVLRLSLVQLLINGEDAGRGGVLGAQTIAAADDGRFASSLAALRYTTSRYRGSAVERPALWCGPEQRSCSRSQEWQPAGVLQRTDGTGWTLTRPTFSPFAVR